MPALLCNCARDMPLSKVDTNAFRVRRAIQNIFPSRNAQAHLHSSSPSTPAEGKLLEECDETGLGYRWEGDQLQGLEKHEPWQASVDSTQGVPPL